MSSRPKLVFLVLRREPIDRILYYLSSQKLDFEVLLPNSLPPTEEESAELVREAQVIVTDITISRRILNNAAKLRFIQNLGAGVEKIDFEALENTNILVANTSGGNSVAVAEHVMALILSLAKKIPILNNQMEKGEFPNLWEDPNPDIIELQGKTLGIIGLGNIGKEVAKRGKAFGMKVIGIKRDKTSKNGLPVDFIGGPEDLEFLLKESDFIAITAPLTPETKGLFREAEFEKMKKTAYIINVSRGPIIDEKALFDALTKGKIAGAGIDAWYKYQMGKQPPSTLPIYILTNVVKTPHIAGLTKEAKEENYKKAAENITKFTRGQLPDHLVNIKLKY